MDFSWSKEQEDLYKKTFLFCRDNLNNDLEKREQEHKFPHEEWKMCGNYGLLGLSVPETYGGIGLDPLTTTYAIEAFGRGCKDMGLVFSSSAHLFACVMPIVKYGSEELKSRFLPKLSNGEWVGANAITEAEAGSDVFALKTRATRDGDNYILSGTKTYVTNGPVADVFLVYASTNPAHGHMGISAFIVEKDTPGLIVGKPFTKMGLTTSPISPIYLEDCVVNQSNMLGKEGEGATIFKISMLWERSCLFAGYVGLMERQLEDVISYATQRRQFRKPISKNQAVSHRIVNMKLRLESARLLLYRACYALNQDKDAVLEISLAKLAVSEAVVASSIDAIQIHGGNGYMSECGIEKSLRDAIPSTIFSGTSEIQRDLIASRLGL